MSARRWSRGREASRPAEARPETDPVIGDLLDDMRALRLHLTADLSAAAGAVEAGADAVAADFVAADRLLIEDFVRQARARLDPVAPEGGAAPATAAAATRDGAPLRRRLLPAAPALAAAAALAAVLYGVVPGHAGSGAAGATQPVAQSWQRFSTLARSDAPAAQVIAAANQLHASLESLIAAAGTDPAKARQALQVLELEQQLLLQDQPQGGALLLAQTRALVVRLTALLPGVATTAPTLLPPAAPTPPAARRRRGFAASPAPSAAPVPSASPSAQPASPAPAPTTSPAPAPSPSPTQIGPLGPSPALPT